jgi:hypothetical protein
MDNRLGERVSIHRTIRLISTRPRTASMGRLVNLSRSGACVVDCDVQLFSLIHVDFDPDVSTKEPWPTIAAYVTRLTDQGVGIEWCEFAPPLVAVLLQTEALLQTEMMTSDGFGERRPEASPETTCDTLAVNCAAVAA